MLENIDDYTFFVFKVFALHTVIWHQTLGIYYKPKQNQTDGGKNEPQTYYNPGRRQEENIPQ